MSKRIDIILSELPKCGVFADIGCDHGYVAKAMLDEDKCQSVIISDVSAECLSKAETLLTEFYPDRFTAVVSDGFEKVGECDLALIAGMGGEVIIGILTRATTLPQNLVLQPMKNSDKVRRELLRLGYAIKKDYTFEDEKFYDIIVAEKGDDCYTEDEYEFGRDNLREKGDAFRRCLQNKMAKLFVALENAGEDGKIRCKEKIEKYSEILK